MKKVILSVSLVLGFILNMMASGNTQTISIKTSGLCEMCKETIEKALAYEKGVFKSEFDEKTGVVMVNFNPKKTDAQKIKKAIAKLGYDADEVKKNEKAFKKLPECCQKEGLMNTK